MKAEVFQMDIGVGTTGRVLSLLVAVGLVGCGPSGGQQDTGGGDGQSVLSGDAQGFDENKSISFQDGSSYSDSTNPIDDIAIPDSSGFSIDAGVLDAASTTSPGDSGFDGQIATD